VIHPSSGQRVRHVAQGSFVVASALRGVGLGKLLCSRMLMEARERGYRSMRFNTVVASNLAAIRVCEACGFKSMCVLPQSFSHPEKGLIDSHIMFRLLDDLEGDIGHSSFLTAVRGTPTPLSKLSQSPISKDSMVDCSNVDINQDFAEQLELVSNLVELRKLEPTKQKRSYGDWMIWMVHRVWLNDPELEELNFNSMSMPDALTEPRIAPKLMQAVGSNTHMHTLSLTNSNVQKAQGVELAESLRRNTTLRVVNLEGNLLDSASVRELAFAIRDNPQTCIEHLRLSHQKQMGNAFGRPTEEAMGQMMGQNETIVKLGFECHDPHWRDTIDRALLRNMDAYRRKQAAEPEESLPAAQEMTLGHLLLEAAPEAGSGEAHSGNASQHELLYRSYVVQSGKLPTSNQLISCAKNSGEQIPYSVAAPLVKECRAWMLNAATGKGVVVTDTFGLPKPGVMVGWGENNDSWSVELTTLEAGESKRYTFRSNREPSFAVSEAWADWLRRSPN
jgi:hypothetical protein